MFKLCLIAIIGVAAAAVCTTTSCTYSAGHTQVFSKMINDDGTANASHERWQCEKSGSGCACDCADSLKCTIKHHHTSGYQRSFDHCEPKTSTLLCPASYTLPFATTAITDRTLGATASTACDISALGGRRIFGNPTINIAKAETALGGSGDSVAYHTRKPKHAAPDSTAPYLLCAGTNAKGETKHGDGHTNNNHMAQRFCELEGYTSFEGIQTVRKDGECAVYHNSGTGRRYDNKHNDKISQIICTDPAPYVAPVLTCQADGSWEADRSCRCSSQDQIFNDPTVNIFATELKLGGSGDPAAYIAAMPLHASPDSNAPYLLCAGTNAKGESKFGDGHTNNKHFADRFCLYHGYPGGHVSIRTVKKDGECAVYHNDGTGRRYDNKHDDKISQIVCVGQCTA